ncbi:MAG: hypothetical protein M3362_11835 [Acidobacteriota bacterium]|nr:hypothetical protein [Acidobacteriota bacterium]
MSTEQKAEIIKALDEAQRQMERAARLLRREGHSQRWANALDIAQQIANKRELYLQDLRLQTSGDVLVSDS